MISSTTQLIEDIQVELEELKFQDPVFHDSLKKRTQIQDAKKEYAVRYSCIQARYLRSSWSVKLQFLTRCIEEIKGISRLVTLLSTIAPAAGKITFYAKTDLYFPHASITTNYVYDCPLKADNRTLQLQVLNEANEEDYLWFRKLNPTQQISLIVGLLRIGGGAITKKMYEILLNVCKTRSDEHQQLINQKTEEEIKSELPEEKRRSSSKLFVITEYYEEPKYNTKDPLYQLVEKQKKKFDDLMKSYKSTLDQKQKTAAQPEEKSKQKKAKKEKKKPAKKDKKKTTKSKKDKKKKAAGNSEESMDWVQLMPIWIVKKIFGYLDKNSLAQAKKVNKYWEYAVSDLAKEVAARTAIDKRIKKIEENMEIIPKAGTAHLIKEKDREPRTVKKMRKLYEAGCTSKKLRLPFTPWYDDSVLSSAPKQLSDQFVMPVKQLVSFPRNGKKYPILHERPAYVYIDCGLLLRKQFESKKDGHIEFLQQKRADEEMQSSSISASGGSGISETTSL